MDTLAPPDTDVDLDCASCDKGLDHCHGTLIAHDDAHECTEAHCHPLDPARHELRVTCAELADCSCTGPEIADLAFAS